MPRARTDRTLNSGIRKAARAVLDSRGQSACHTPIAEKKEQGRSAKCRKSCPLPPEVCHPLTMSRFTIEQMRTFMTVVRLGGVHRAAQAMNLTHFIHLVDTGQGAILPLLSNYLSLVISTGFFTRSV